MRKSIWAAVVLSALLLLCEGWSAEAPPDEAAAVSVAVLPFGLGEKVPSLVSDALVKKLCFHLAKKERLEIMDGEKMLEILARNKVGILTTCDSSRCIARLGKLLGVEKVVAGGVVRSGDGYLANLRLVDVATMSDLAMASEVVKSGRDGDIEAGAEALAASLAKELTEEESDDEQKMVFVSEVVTIPDNAMGRMFGKGVELYKEKKYGEALKVLTEACKLPGGTENMYAEAHALRGLIYQFHTEEEARYKKAYYAYRLALEWNPKNKLARKNVWEVKDKQRGE